MKQIHFSTFIILLIVSCSPSQEKEIGTLHSDLDQIKKVIASSNIVYWQAFEKGDSKLFIERYSKDACIMVPNAPSMCGERAAQSFFEIAYDSMGIRNGKFTTTEIFGTGHFVIENGLFELRDSLNNLIDDGKYLVLWKKTEEGWKMFRDSFSSNNLN